MPVSRLSTRNRNAQIDTLERSALQVGLFSNSAICFGVATMAVLQLALIYVPLMNRLFATAPIGRRAWLEISSVGLASWLVVGLEKRYLNRHKKSKSSDNR
ncbi:cation transporting ATPase C-terminal domain-containing protein [Propionivibrio sp.]|uniref:cation transporting ATPase C-terminal domain-containing protein n=1 Tax=Propionivibrio sp. TaxID=2212460 RepID=UPI003BF0CC85